MNNKLSLLLYEKSEVGSSFFFYLTVICFNSMYGKVEMVYILEVFPSKTNFSIFTNYVLPFI